ncbi:hypothetical protein SNR37_003105 [Agarivorans aestuarii]|uniref:Uncharacterized protein n=1 Tax=Agarivorans aestuarii TaxID=1563703 RepID=A0ABU7G2P9_9ALTE|nr:hypothetical protein [Agarivorans aestuarii]MEE1673679.1 hypothetical protein [Agarivorans aestuarii]
MFKQGIFPLNKLLVSMRKKIERRVSSFICFSAGGYTFYHFCLALFTLQAPSLGRNSFRVYALAEDPVSFWLNVTAMFVIFLLLFWLGYTTIKTKSEWKDD